MVDSHQNQKYSSNILWWVDIGTADVLPNVVNAVIQNFGLPDDISDNFYSDFLGPERESRIVLGSGNVSKASIKAANDDQPLAVRSLSLFTQCKEI